jgi:hypothetical protein
LAGLLGAYKLSKERCALFNYLSSYNIGYPYCSVYKAHDAFPFFANLSRKRAMDPTG